MTRASRPARLRIVLGWPVGIAAVSWRYMWRTIPLHRCEVAGTRADLPDAAHGASAFADRLQPLGAGVGPMMHRSYGVRITGTSMTPSGLIDLVSARLDQASPEMAVFRKTRGAQGALRQGDEFVIRMPGPWDGPVRVVRRDRTSFRLATLDGHLEAGEIEFHAQPDGDALRFEIESWARAGDRLSALLYNKLRLAKEIQLNMWSHFCVRVASGHLRHRHVVPALGERLPPGDGVQVISVNQGAVRVLSDPGPCALDGSLALGHGHVAGDTVKRRASGSPTLARRPGRKAGSAGRCRNKW